MKNYITSSIMPNAYKYYSCNNTVLKVDPSNNHYYILDKNGHWNVHAGTFNLSETNCMLIHNKFDFFVSKYFTHYMEYILLSLVLLFFFTKTIFFIKDKYTKRINMRKDINENKTCIKTNKADDCLGKDNIIYSARVLGLLEKEDLKDFWPNDIKTVNDWDKFICNKLSQVKVSDRNFDWYLKEFNIFSILMFHYYGRESRNNIVFNWRKNFYNNFIKNNSETVKNHNEEKSLAAFREVAFGDFFEDSGLSYDWCGNCNESREDFYINHVLPVNMVFFLNIKTGLYSNYEYFDDSPYNFSLTSPDIFVKKISTVEELIFRANNSNYDERMAFLLRHSVFFVDTLSKRDMEYFTFISTPGSRANGFLTKLGVNNDCDYKEEKQDYSYINSFVRTIQQMDKNALLTKGQQISNDYIKNNKRYIQKYFGFEDSLNPAPLDVLKVLNISKTIEPTIENIDSDDVNQINGILFSKHCSMNVFTRK